MHWFDPSTIEVLGALLDMAGGGLLVVVTGRPGKWLPANWAARTFDLAGLTDEQTDELIIALAPNLSAEDRAAVACRGDGVPFYIHQLVAGFSETGVPDALYEPLFARLRASPNVVPVLEAAAVIGRVVDRGLLCSVVDITDDDLDEVLDELEDALVLEPWEKTSWRFRHELLREVAAELAPPSVRRGLHAKVADALTSGGDPDWRLVAAHYQQGERFDEAASAYRQASTDARLRGALAEAGAYLTQSLAQLDQCTPGTGRDRREMAVRLERGFLALAEEGYQSRTAAGDVERCLQLGGTDLRDDQLFATLVALAGYYMTSADLRRAAEVIESLRSGLEEGRLWFRPTIEAMFGVVAWLRGEFSSAGFHLEVATADEAEADDHKVDAVWFLPDDPIGVAHIHLALIYLVRGDLFGAEAALARAAHRAEQLAFPQGAFTLAYTRAMESWLSIEIGDLDRAAELAASVSELGERHGLDQWRLYGATLQASADGLAALGTDNRDPAALPGYIATLSTLLDTWRTFGLNIYLTQSDALLARLLIAAGQPEAARERLDTALALAQDTGMCFYDAELLRIAPTPTPTAMPSRPTCKQHLNPPDARVRRSSNYAPPSTISSCGAILRALRLLRRSVACRAKALCQR